MCKRKREREREREREKEKEKEKESMTCFTLLEICFLSFSEEKVLKQFSVSNFW